MSDILPNATLLFADIAGFTGYSAAHEAEVVVNMLKHLMTEFDKLCLENTVYKVYTIGGNLLIKSYRLLCSLRS